MKPHLVSLLLICYTFPFLKLEEAKGSNSEGKPAVETPKQEKFIPTKEWQTIREGQAIPGGLHVRINLATGGKEAKLLDEETENSNPSALLNVGEGNSPSESGKSDASQAKLDHEELKMALKKIRNIAPESEPSTKNFRSFEEIKKDMEEIQHTIKTEAEIIKDLVSSYASVKKNSDMIRLLEDLEFYAHKYDNALDFIKMGGFKSIVIPALNSTENGIRSAAALLLGSACQSNPKAQIAAIEMGVLPVLVRLVSFDSDLDVRNRALFALSAVIRNFPLAQQAFIVHGGISAFTKLFTTDSADSLKLQLKITTLLSDLVLEKQSVNAYTSKAEESTIDHEDSNDEKKENESKLEVEKRRQYEALNVETALVEQGFCLLLPRLLTTIRPDDKQTRREDLSSFYGRPLREEHDVVEKVITAMLTLSSACRDQFQPAGKTILLLKDRYEILSTKEKSEHLKDEEGDYFTRLYSMCRQLSTQLLQHDEL